MPQHKLRCVARVIGAVQQTGEMADKHPDWIQQAVLSVALRDQDVFYNAFNDEFLTTKFDVHEAIDSGYLMWDLNDPTTLLHRNGERICQTALGTDRVEYAAKFLATRSPETLNSIQNLLGRGRVAEEPSEAATAQSENNKYAEIMKNGTKTQIIDAIIEYSDAIPERENKLIYFDGAYGKWGQTLLRMKDSKERGRESVRECLLNDEFLFNEIRREFAKRII